MRTGRVSRIRRLGRTRIRTQHLCRQTIGERWKPQYLIDLLQTVRATDNVAELLPCKRGLARFLVKLPQLIGRKTISLARPKDRVTKLLQKVCTVSCWHR